MRLAPLRAVVLALVFGASRLGAVCGQDPGADARYKQAAEAFRHAIGKRHESPSGPEWRTLLIESSRLFEQIASDLESDESDVAWIYLVRVAYEAGDWNGVARAADRANAFWDSPESRARATREPSDSTERTSHVAAIDYWRAAALVAAHDDEAALRVLETFRAKYGQEASFYVGSAMALQAEVLLRREAFDAAERLIFDLAYGFPGEGRLPALVARLAEHDRQLAERYGRQEREIQRRIEALADQRLGVLQRIRLARVAGESADELKKQLDDMSASKVALTRDQAEFLAHAIEIDHTLEGLRHWINAASPGTRIERHGDDASARAFRQFRLAKLKDDDSSEWDSARELFEAWFSLPSVQALPKADLEWRRNCQSLGEAYFRLAGTTQSPARRSTYVAIAVRYLVAV